MTVAEGPETGFFTKLPNGGEGGMHPGKSLYFNIVNVKKLTYHCMPQVEQYLHENTLEPDLARTVSFEPRPPCYLWYQGPLPMTWVIEFWTFN